MSPNYHPAFIQGVKFEIKTMTFMETPNARRFKNVASSDIGLTYGSTPALITGDSFTGALARDPGTSVGFYNITQGNLALSTNYTLALTAGVKFEVKVRPITVTAVSASQAVHAATSSLGILAHS